MKLPPFEYRRATTLDECLELLAEHGDDAKVLAGGQSLIPLMAFRLARPGVLVDIGGVDELKGVRSDDGHLVLGAGTTQAAVEDAEVVAERQPLLREALGWVGHRPIRNRGTVGGSLAHADPAAELPLVALALDAELELRSTSGARRVPADEFFEGFLTTACTAEELLTAVHLPAPAPATGSAFAEVARRHGDFAMVSAAATLTLADDGTVASARLCLGAVDQRPVRLPALEAAITGLDPTGAEARSALADAGDLVSPSDDLHATAAYRRRVGTALLAQAVARAATTATAALTEVPR